MPYLQTKEGKKAKATVQEEFEDVMCILHQEAAAQLPVKSGIPDLTPLYIFDNVSLQKEASSSRIGYSRHAHVKTPAHSPDFNKPIEHVFNQIKDRILVRLDEEAGVVITGKKAQKWVRQAFEAVTTESLQADIMSLLDTWAIVKSAENVTVTTSKQEEMPGSNGDYPSSEVYR
jgi:hypothetical protein